MSKRGGKRTPGPGKSLGRPTVDEPKTYADYRRIAFEEPKPGDKEGKTALGWFGVQLSPAERTELIKRMYVMYADGE